MAPWSNRHSTNVNDRLIRTLAITEIESTQNTCMLAKGMVSKFYLCKEEWQILYRLAVCNEWL